MPAGRAVLRPASADELVALVQTSDARLLPRGGGSKPALSSLPGGAHDAKQSGAVVELGAITGILSYEPSEFTVSVRAGTTLREIDAALREHGQALPFDPPWIEASGPAAGSTAGSTAGGAVAAGLSGPGRLRGGGVRDAVLAVRFVDGRGRHARAGAPVVKNAAGFDVPKLLVGSLGRLAILTEITFKVLPAPRAFASAAFAFPGLEEARRGALSLLKSPFELDGLDVSHQGVDCEAVTGGGAWRLALRIGGAHLPQRLERIARHLGKELTTLDDAAFWRRRRDVTWAAADRALAWIPITAGRLLAFDAALRDIESATVYAGGLSHAWLAFEPSALPAVDALLHRLDLAGLLIRDAAHSAWPDPVLGRVPGQELSRRVKAALDPHGRFLPLGRPRR